jgi:type I restriction enzyme S subunit
MIDSIIKGFDVWTDAQGVKSKGRVKSIDNISLEGIARLRELILDFAIRGKLVQQDENDEPSKILIGKSNEEKDRRIEEGEIKKHKKLDAITNEMFPFELPNGWEWAWFADVYFFQEGPGIRNWQFRSEGIKLLNVQNIVNNKLVLDNTDKYIDEDEYREKYLHFTIQENDLLFASSGGSWGKSAFFTDPGYTVIVNTSTIRIHPYVNESSRTYLKSFLDSNFFKNQMIEQLVGMQPNFGSTHFLKILVPIPPANEQNRIAAKIAQLMSLCDKLEEEQTKNLTTHHHLVKCLLETLTQANDADELQSSWEKISQHFDILFCTEDSIELLKDAILQLAVIGKLVKQNPNDEPVGVLLERIENDKELSKNRKNKSESTKTPSEENILALPNGWQWISLGSVTEIKGGKRLPAGHSFSLSETPYIYVQVTNMKNGSIIDNDLKYLSKETQSEISNYTIEKDDLYITIAGTIGDVGIVPDFFDGMNLTENAAKIVFKQLNKFWLQRVLSSKLLQDQFIEKTNQLAQPKLALHRVASSLIPVCPVEEQERIVSKIDELFSICNSLKDSIVSCENIKTDLSNTIISTAI